MTNVSVPFYARLSLNLVSIFILGALIYIGSDIIMPICFAVVLAMLLLPVVNWFIRKGIPGVPAMLLAIFLALLFVSAIIYFLSSQVASFMDDLPAIKEKLNHHLSTIQSWINQQLNITPKQQKQAVESAKENLSGSGGMSTVVMGIAGSVITMVLLPIYTFLILFYRKLIHKFLLDVFTAHHQSKVEDVLEDSKKIVQGYLTGLLIEMVIVTILNAAGFLILGVQYSIFLAVLAAILNLIPYIGMLVASVICMAVTLTTSDQISDVIWVGVVLVAVQFIDNNFISPYVVSSKVRINALVSIIGVLIGGALAGVSGMFLSIPGMAICKAIFERVEGLKPWGEILGDDRPTTSILTRKSNKSKQK